MSNSVPLTIKWGKETVNLSFQPAIGVKGLKAELSEKTGVPSDRMKLMAKSKGLWKGVLKDETDLSAIDWNAAQSKAGASGLQLLLMGSAAKLSGPKVKTVFLEDLPPEEVAKVVEPAGLINLGNTCYLNSVVQCLRVVPALRTALQQYSPATNGSSSTAQNAGKRLFLASLKDTYNKLDRQSEALQPGQLVQATKMAFPQFAQTGPHGQPMQQDAEEFYSGLLTIAASETSGADKIQQAMTGSLKNAEDLLGAANVVDAVFGMKMKETLTCDELTNDDNAMMTDDGDNNNNNKTAEPPVTSFDIFRKLTCNIQGGSDGAAQTNVSHIAEGIALSLSGKIEKHSEVLGRDSVWTRQQRIARLPPVLTVQFGRFYWKATPDSQDHAGVKCKVMKPVTFNSTLDVYDFCTADVQKVLKKARDKALAAEEHRINQKLKGQADDNKTDAMETEEKEETNAAANGKQEDDEDLQAALAMSLETTDDDEKQPPIGPGLPDDFQGVYELFAVVTHKGRDADGGHYMAWVKAPARNNNQGKAQKIADTDEDNEDWFVFDDDEVSPCKTEDVLKLKGGGDWHMSYLNFYRAKK